MFARFSEPFIQNNASLKKCSAWESIHCSAPRFVLLWMLVSPGHRTSFSQNAGAGLHRDSTDSCLIRPGALASKAPHSLLCCQFNEQIPAPTIPPQPLDCLGVPESQTSSRTGHGLLPQQGVPPWSCTTPAPSQG